MRMTPSSNFVIGVAAAGTKGLKHCVDCLVPLTAGLLETVEGFFELPDIAAKARGARRSLHEDLLGQLAIEKSGVDVEVIEGSDDEERGDGGELQDWCKHLGVVNAFDLGEPLHN